MDTPVVEVPDSDQEENTIHHNTVRFTPDGYVYVLDIISTCLYMREDGMMPSTAQRMAKAVYEKLKRTHGTGHGFGHLPQCFSYYPPGKCYGSLPIAATVEGAKHVISLLDDLPPLFRTKVANCKDFPSLVNSVMNVHGFKKDPSLNRPPSPHIVESVFGNLEVSGVITADYIVTKNGLVVSDHPGWDDIKTPLTSVSVAGDNPPASVLITNLGGGANTVKLFANSFDTSNPQPKEMFINIQLPHAWKAGTELRPHVHFIKSGTGVGHVKFGLEYSWANVMEAFPTSSTVYMCTSAELTAADQYKHIIASRSTAGGTTKASIVNTSKRDSSMLMMRLFRNVNDAEDTLNEAVWALEFDIHILHDTFGSWYEYPGGDP
eukprot:jgi/Mesvir1/1477/Mv14460-RA.1